MANLSNSTLSFSSFLFDRSRLADAAAVANAKPQSAWIPFVAMSTTVVAKPLERMRSVVVMSHHPFLGIRIHPKSLAKMIKYLAIPNPKLNKMIW